MLILKTAQTYKKRTNDKRLKAKVFLFNEDQHLFKSVPTALGIGAASF